MLDNKIEGLSKYFKHLLDNTRALVEDLVHLQEIDLEGIQRNVQLCIELNECKENLKNVIMNSKNLKMEIEEPMARKDWKTVLHLAGDVLEDLVEK